MIVIYGLAIIGAIFISLLIYAQISDWMEVLREKSYWKRYKDSGNQVGDMLNAAHYWLTGNDRKPYRELIQYLSATLKETGGVNSELLRSKVDQLIDEANQAIIDKCSNGT